MLVYRSIVAHGQRAPSSNCVFGRLCVLCVLYYTTNDRHVNVLCIVCARRLSLFTIHKLNSYHGLATQHIENNYSVKAAVVAVAATKQFIIWLKSIKSEDRMSRLGAAANIDLSLFPARAHAVFAPRYFGSVLVCTMGVRWGKRKFLIVPGNREQYENGM